MRILIEEYRYKADDVRETIHGIDALEDIEGYVSVNYVGYYFNSHPDVYDCVFILPKVLLEVKNGQELVFGQYRPEDIICITEDSKLTDEQKNFIYDFSVWIYRAVVVFYNDKRNDTSIVYHKKMAQVNKGRKQRNNTFLDILLSLIQFNDDNQQFFLFIIKNMHAGFNKINWTRTIARTNAVVQDNSAIYVNPVNKKRQINFDEELLVIFFSILNYINEHYGFPVKINCNYELITGRKFQSYLNGFGKIRLQQIKYKYFSDKAIQLWNLCYAFFDRAKNVTIDMGQKDYLLVKNFNIVFEAIIDELIGETGEVPAGLKKQEDGKMVDHIYTYKGLTTHEEDKPIYYIGDSKYYKRNNPIGRESVAKQFTYARNVIQWNLNLFMKGDPEDEDWKKDWNQFREVPKLRDDVTEGYNIIPNFFISATMEEDLSYKDTIRLTEKKNKYFTSDQFSNRLFDRDTLLVCHYDVNFLFVVSLYALNNKSKKAGWKKKVRAIFREEIQRMLQERYQFYAMRSHPDEDGRKYIKTHFQDVLGKMYTPYENTDYFSLALDKKDEGNNEKLLEELRKHFYVVDCSLGDNPQTVIEKAIIETPALIKEKPAEKNILTGLVRRTASDFKKFMDHEAKSYVMEKIPNINMMSIRYFLPMVAGSVDGYYEVERIGFTTVDNQPALRLRLGRYIPIGESMVEIYRSKMQPGELISYDYTLKMYNGEV
jgi:hypothetical protein